MMSEGQASLWLMQHAASYVKTQGSVEWWKLANGSWVSKVKMSNGMYELRSHAAGSCNCGG